MRAAVTFVITEAVSYMFSHYNNISFALMLRNCLGVIKLNLLVSNRAHILHTTCICPVASYHGNWPLYIWGIDAEEKKEIK